MPMYLRPYMARAMSSAVSAAGGGYVVHAIQADG